MRADRLLSLLLLLQTRGCLTAAQLAGELEVTERTIYRDVEALSSAGIPIYTTRGPGGGIQLIEEYRTTLNGLSSAELRALLLLSMTGPLEALGIGGELRSALLKLSTRPNAPARPQTARIHLDASWWFQHDGQPPSHLKTIQNALWNNQLLEIEYRTPLRTALTLLVAPYGLVAKTNLWYLVCQQQERLRVLQVANIQQARLLPQQFDLPDEFDLAAFWKDWCADYENSRQQFTVQARGSPALAALRSGQGFETLATPEQSSPNDWQLLTLTFESFEAARTRILGFGSAIEVLQPTALRRSLVDFAQQTLAIYSTEAR
jgi:predicted DNA-binding transcriptional regulator YafY